MTMLPPASSGPTSREDALARIRATSRDEVTLAEMQRLGFWPAQHDDSPAAQLVQREAELTRALSALGAELREVDDPVLALRRMRKERMAQAKIRREETRQRRAAERHARAQAWHVRRASELLYLGEDVSAGLGDARSDADRLARLALPALHDASDLAQAMGVSLHELRFLAFDRRVSRISHYRRFAMPKKTGGERMISAPMPRLKRVQYWVLDNVLTRVPVHGAVHGFLAGRSIVSNAAPHVGRAVVINVDLKDFFPTIDLPRVRGVFTQLGFGKQVATTLALLCTEAPTEQVSIDGETFHVALGARVLPQGAPSSPALTNILCRRLDARLQGAAAKLGFTYTRYADDLTFSADEDGHKLAGKLLWRVRQIVIDEGFTPHPQKQHVMRDSARQSVTGIVVNTKPAVSREMLRRFRATLFQVEKDGPAGKQWNGNENVLAALEGYAHFINMVDAGKGAPLLARVRQARVTWGGSEALVLPPANAGRQRTSAFRVLSAQGKAPWDGFWQAVTPPAPVLEKTAEQLKIEKKTARTASDAPTSATASRAGRKYPVQDAPTPDPAHHAKASRRRAVPWLSLFIQLLLASTLMNILDDGTPLVCAVIAACLSCFERQANWPRFALMMGMAALIVRFLYG